RSTRTPVPCQHLKLLLQFVFATSWNCYDIDVLVYQVTARLNGNSCFSVADFIPELSQKFYQKFSRVTLIFKVAVIYLHEQPRPIFTDNAFRTAKYLQFVPFNVDLHQINPRNPERWEISVKHMNFYALSIGDIFIYPVASAIE